MPETFKSLVCQGLGYCCPFAFLSLFHSTGKIADRLGVAPRTVRVHKAAFHRGELQCEKCEKCLAKQPGFRSAAKHKPW